MAEFTTACPHCNAELQAQTEWIGMEAECTECQTSFVIQAPVTAAAPVVQVAASAEHAISNPPVEPFLKKHKKWCVIAALWLSEFGGKKLEFVGAIEDRCLTSPKDGVVFSRFCKPLLEKIIHERGSLLTDRKSVV